jgi:hypothetical protein
MQKRHAEIAHEVRLAVSRRLDARSGHQQQNQWWTDPIARTHPEGFWIIGNLESPHGIKLNLPVQIHGTEFFASSSGRITLAPRGVILSLRGVVGLDAIPISQQRSSEVRTGHTSPTKLPIHVYRRGGPYVPSDLRFYSYISRELQDVLKQLQQVRERPERKRKRRKWRWDVRHFEASTSCRDRSRYRTAHAREAVPSATNIKRSSENREPLAETPSLTIRPPLARGPPWQPSLESPLSLRVAKQRSFLRWWLGFTRYCGSCGVFCSDTASAP